MTRTTTEMNTMDLETVSGGVIGECNKDSKFLTDIGIMKSEVGCMDLTFHWKSSSKKVDDAWQSVGIRCVSKPAGDNVYYINGKKVSRNDAIKAAACATGFSGPTYSYLD